MAVRAGGTAGGRARLLWVQRGRFPGGHTAASSVPCGCCDLGLPPGQVSVLDASSPSRGVGAEPHRRGGCGSQGRWSGGATRSSLGLVWLCRGTLESRPHAGLDKQAQGGPASAAPPALGGMVWTLTHRTWGWGPLEQPCLAGSSRKNGSEVFRSSLAPAPPPPRCPPLALGRLPGFPLKGQEMPVASTSPCNWSPSAFLKSSLKAFGRYLCPWGHCREDRPLKSRLCAGGGGARPVLPQR